MKAVAVIIVGTNERDFLYRALSTILENGFSDRLEVIYVDNNSQDKSVDFVKAYFPSVHILISHCNLGYSGANNLGIDRALSLKVDYLFLLNPDTASPQGLIKACVKFMEAHPDFGAIGPLQSVYGEKLNTVKPSLNTWSQLALRNGEQHTFYMHFPQFFLIEEPVLKQKKIENVLEHAYIQGCAIFVRSHLFKEGGWFDATYHTYYEEVDLCRRIRWLGYRVGLLTNVFIQHQGGGSTKESLYKKKLMMRNKYYFLLTDPTWNLRYTGKLLIQWLHHDLILNFPKDVSQFLQTLLWIFLHLPKIVLQRAKHQKISKGLTLKFHPKASDA